MIMRLFSEKSKIQIYAEEFEIYIGKKIEQNLKQDWMDLRNWLASDGVLPGWSPVDWH